MGDDGLGAIDLGGDKASRDTFAILPIEYSIVFFVIHMRYLAKSGGHDSTNKAGRHGCAGTVMNGVPDVERPLW
jgi:hypothetical protein